MDVGVGSFVVASGLAAGSGGRNPALGFGRAVRSIMALIVLGKWRLPMSVPSISTSAAGLQAGVTLQLPLYATQSRVSTL